MAEGNIMDKLMSLPKWALISIAAVVVGIFLFFIVSSFMPEKEVAQESQGPQNVLVDIPDAVETKSDGSLLKMFQRNEYDGDKKTATDYWNELEGDSPSTLKTDPFGGPKVDDLDPSVYSEIEREYIRNGFKTKEQIDKEHAERDAAAAAAKQQSSWQQSAPRPMTQAQQDSIYFARLEKAYQVAAKYQQPAASEEPEKEPEEEQPRQIDLSESKDAVLPTDSFSDDGIISSLESSTQLGGANFRSRPVKATFLKTERLASGQRVIIRLMQDLLLSDGTVIPANTHITGICEMDRRLKININMLHYGGKMFPTDLSIYDNDGTEGLYCATAESSKKAKNKASKVAGDVAQSAGTVLGTMLTGNPLLGMSATSGIRAATSSLTESGDIVVDVSAGYEFYIFENVKDDASKGR